MGEVLYVLVFWLLICFVFWWLRVDLVCCYCCFVFLCLWFVGFVVCCFCCLVFCVYCLVCFVCSGVYVGCFGILVVVCCLLFTS